MNWVHINRIAWKEYRRMGGFWLALFVFWLMCLGFSIWSVLDRNLFEIPWTAEQGWMVVLMTAAVHALGCASLSFATEHEEGTHSYLSTLPVDGRSVFYGKLIYGVGSSLLLVAAMAVVGWVYVRWLSSNSGGLTTDSNDLWSTSSTVAAALMILCAIGIGIFWSLRIRAPLLALTLAAISVWILPYACLLGLAVLLGRWGALDAYGRLRGIEHGSEVSNPISLMSAVVIGVLAVAFLAVDRWLAPYWLPTGQPRSSKRSAAARAEIPLTRFSRLIWLHSRERMYLLISILLLLACSPWIGRLRPIAVAFCGLIGVMTYRPEKKLKRFRWLAQIGVSPSMYWFSRLFVPSIAVLTVIIANSIYSTWLRPGWGLHREEEMAFWAFGFLATFAIGQFCSLAISSTILAIAATLILSLLAWAMLIYGRACSFPFWAVALPVVLLPLITTYLRIPRWFRETGSWRQWAIPSIPMVMMLIGLPLAIIGFRIYEVPGVLLTDSLLNRPPDPAIINRSELLQQAIELIPITDLGDNLAAPTLGSLQNCRELNEMTEKIGVAIPDRYRPPTIVPLPVPISSGAQPTTTRLASVLIGKATKAEEDDDAAAAWRFYEATLHLALVQNDGKSGFLDSMIAQNLERCVYERMVVWAMLESNSADQIEEVAERLNQLRQQHPSWNLALWSEYQLSKESTIRTATSTNPMLLLMSATAQQFPWEQIRADRLRDYLFSATYQSWDVSKPEQAVRTLGPKDAALCFHLRNTTFTSLDAEFDSYDPSFDDIENVRRGTIYQLMAIAYHLRNGKYPARFDNMMLGEEKLPFDLYSPHAKMYRRENEIVSGRVGNGPAHPGLKEWHRSFLLPDFESWNDATREEAMRGFEIRLNTVPYDLVPEPLRVYVPGEYGPSHHPIPQTSDQNSELPQVMPLDVQTQRTLDESFEDDRP